MSGNLFDYYFYKKTKSTNDEIKKVTEIKKNNVALFSQIQTEGRGRVKKKWYSSDGDLTCSFFINKKLSSEKIGQINIWFLSKIISVLKEKFKKINFKIKWPNDIYINNKKLAGILTETNVEKGFISNIIIGIGINIVSSPSNTDYPTTCLSFFNYRVDPVKLFLSISKKLSDSLYNFDNKNLIEPNSEFLKNFEGIGEIINIKLGSRLIKGRFLEVDNNGHLIIQENNVIKQIKFGSII